MSTQFRQVLTRTVFATVILATVILANLALAPALVAQSQATTGVIEGTVLDQEGGLLPGTTVTLRNTATNFEQVLVTDGRGRFRGLLLPLGPYAVTAALDGFATLTTDEFQLRIGQTITLRLEMRLSATADEITVTDVAPLIETSRTQNTVTIDRETLDGIPNNGRNFLEFTKLTPGVAVVQGPDGDELSINGQKGIHNNIAVDGADFNNPFFGEQRGGQRPAFTFNMDAVQEFVVVADGAPAEFGRSSGGFVNVITKSGTNALQGTAHAFYQDDSLSTEAERPDGTDEPKFPSERTQVGFTLGGPLRTDRIFGFTAFDFQDATRTKQNDPTRIPQVIVDTFAALGSPGENLPIDHTDDAAVFLAKVDFHLGSGQLFTARYNYTDSEQVNGTFDVDTWGRSANAIELDESHAFSGSLLSNLTDSQLNELRFQYAKEERPRPYNGPNIAGGDRPLPDIAFDFANGFRFGMPFFIPVEYNDTRWQITDNFSWLKGSHTVKAGVEWTQTQAFQTFIGFANGRFIFGSTDGFLNYAANPSYVECSDGSSSPTGVCPEGTSITGPVLLYLQQAGVGDLTAEEAGTQTITQTEPSVFIQDTWQPRDNLTVQYGFRWEAQDQADVITPADEVFFADFVGQTVDGNPFPSNGDIPSDWRMWQPRFGLSWDPTRDGKTVLRANYGVYYARIPGLSLASTRSTNGSRGQTLFRNSELTPILGAPPPITQLIPQESVGDPFRPDVFVFDENFRNPRTNAAALSIEREVRTGTSLLLKWNWARTMNVTRFVNRNDPLLSADPSDGLGPWSTGLGPGGFNGIGALTTVESSASSLYIGYTFGITQRSRNFQAQAFYTYSKDRSSDDNERDPFTFRYARVTDLDAEWGLSDRDQRDRLNAWVLWNAPYGIDVNARFTYRSPQPLSLTENGEVAGTPQDRINADGTIMRRNTGRKDNEIRSLDLRISKTFDLGGFRVEAIAEGFNVLNSRNLRRPEVTNLVFNFDGTVQSGTGDPRQWQLGLRLMW